MEDELKSAKQTALKLMEDGREWKRVRFDAKKSQATLDHREAHHAPTKDKARGHAYSMWRCTVDLPAPVAAVEQLIEDAGKLKQWNPVLQEANVVRQVDKSTDVVSYVFQAHAGGLVSPREFVVLRHRETLSDAKGADPGDARLLLAIGHDHDAKAVKGRVLGWTGPSGFLLQPKKDPAKCRMTWLINSDSKLPKTIPKALADRIFIKIVIGMMRSLRAILSQPPNPAKRT